MALQPHVALACSSMRLQRNLSLTRAPQGQIVNPPHFRSPPSSLDVNFCLQDSLWHTGVILALHKSKPLYSALFDESDNVIIFVDVINPSFVSMFYTSTNLPFKCTKSFFICFSQSPCLADIAPNR